MLTQRIEAIRQNYVNTKPQISCERAKIWTDSHRETEGQPVAIRRARAFADLLDQMTAVTGWASISLRASWWWGPSGSFGSVVSSPRSSPGCGWTGRWTPLTPGPRTPIG